MAIAYVQQHLTNGATVAYSAYNPIATVPVGHTLIFSFVSSLNTSPITGCVDSQSNVWHVRSAGTQTGMAITVCWSTLTTQLTTSDTITPSGGGGNLRAYTLEEFSGLSANEDSVAFSSGGSGNSANMAMVAAHALAANGNLMWVAYGVNTSGTFTKDPSCTLPTTGSIGTTKAVATEYEIISSGGTPSVTGSFTGGVNWNGVMLFIQAPASNDAITPTTNISATSTVSGGITKPPKSISPTTNVAATSSMSGGLAPGARRLNTLTISATSTASITVLGALRGLSTSTISVLAQSFMFGNRLVKKDWPQAGATPSAPGTYGATWRSSHRPGVDGMTKDGVTGPTWADETGSPYPVATTGHLTRIAGSTYPVLGTAINPALIVVDEVNGISSTVNGVTTNDLSTVLPADNIFQMGDGKWMLRNATICGTIIVDGAQQEVQSDYLLSATPQTITISGNATKSTFGGTAGAGFPTISGSYYVMVGSTLCTYDHATSTTLVNVATADSKSHQVFAGQWATSLNTANPAQAFHGAHFRNLRWAPPSSYNLLRVQSTLASDFVVSAAAQQAQISTGNTITAGTSPSTITVASTTGFASSGTLLVGSDFVTYTGTTSTTFTGCTWPGGGATSGWIGGGSTTGYWIYSADNLTIALTDASSFPTSGTIEIDASLEVHYTGKSGNSLTGCALASHFSSVVRTYPAGLDVRTCIGAAYAESQDNGAGWGCFGVYGAWADLRDCMNSYSGKGPGAFRFNGSIGTTIDRQYSEFNWYDVAHVLQSSAQTNITNSIFVTHPGSGNTGAPHIDGFQGWDIAQLDGTPIVENCAFLGGVTNAHEFWSPAQSTNANAANFPPPTGLFYQNCLIASSQVGTSTGKGGLIDESVGCGAKNCWYDGALFQTIGGPGPETTTTSLTLANATSIGLGSVSGIGFSATSPNTTTLSGDITVTRDTSYAQILSSLGLTDASAFGNSVVCYIVLDDGSKSCALRADYKSTNTLEAIRWLNGTPGTYTAASTTVYCARTTGSPPVNGMFQVALDAQGRMGVFAYTGTSGFTLTGLKAMEYDIPAGAIVTPMDPSHGVPANLVISQNQQWNGSAWVLIPGDLKTPVGSIAATSTASLTRIGFGRLVSGSVAATSAMGGAIVSNRYWVGGSGNWSDTTHWASTSGGAGGASVPSASFAVFFDGNSGSGTITVDATSTCQSLTCTGYTGTFDINGKSFNIGNSTVTSSALTLSAGMTLAQTGGGTITFTISQGGAGTVTTAGKGMPSCTFQSGGTATGSWTFLDAFSTLGASNTITHSTGVLNTNGQTCSWGAFNGSTTTTRTLTLGSSAITITGTSSTAWNMGTNTALTMSANTAVVTLTGAGAGVSLNNQNMSGTSFVFNGGGTYTWAVNNATVNNLTFTSTAVKTDAVNLSTGNFTVSGTLTCTGNSTVNRLFMISGGPSSPNSTARTITAAAVSLTNVDFFNVTGAGAASPFTGTSLGNCLGNSGITFDTPATQTWQGTGGGNWSDVTKWTSRVPLPQDNVVFASAFVSTPTITIDMQRIGANIDWSGSSGSPKWSYGTGIASQMWIFGSLNTTNLGSIVATNSAKFCLAGRSALTITTGGVSVPGGAGNDLTAYACFGATYTLQDNLSWGCSPQWNFGTLNANGHNVSVFGFGCNPSTGLGSGGLGLGTGTWTLTGTGTVWNVNSNAVLVPSTSTILMNNSGGSAITFAGGGQTYATVQRPSATGAGALTISGNNCFTNLDIETTTAHTVTLPASGYQVVTGTLTLNGASGQLLSLVSSSPGTATTLWATTYTNNGFQSLSSDVTVNTTTARFWVGGTGSWNDPTHWSTTTGGTSGAAPPASANAVTFDSNSGTAATVTALSTYSTNPAAASITINKSDLTLTHTLGSNVVGAVTLTTGTLNTNGQSCSWGSFSSSNANARTLTLGASAIALTGSATVVFTTATSTSLTVTTNTAVLTVTQTNSSINLGGINYNGLAVVFSGTGGSSTVSVASNTATISNLTAVGRAFKTDGINFGGSGSLTITGALTLTGNSTVNRLLVSAQVLGTARPIGAATVSLANVDFMDIAASGVAAPWTGTSLGDCLGNSGITFDSSSAQTWQGTSSGNWSDVSKWTSRVPLPQDDVVVTGSFSSAQTITQDMPRIGRSIDFTGLTSSGTKPIWSVGVSCSLYGSLTMSANMSVSGTSQFTFHGRGAETITCGGTSLTFQPRIDATNSGSYTCQDDFLGSGSSAVLQLGSGTFTANGHNVTVVAFNGNSSVTGTPILNLGTGTWSLYSSGSGTIWQVASAVTVNASTSTIQITSTDSGFTKIFAGGGKSYNTVKHISTGSDGLTITGNNTFSALDLECSTARTITLDASGTNTITGPLTFAGTSGQLLSFVSSSPGTHTTIVATPTASVTRSNFSFSGDIIFDWQLPITVQIGATSSMSGALIQPHALKTAQISATSTTSGSVAKRVLLRTASIAATSTTSTTSSSIHINRAILTAQINATSTTSGAIVVGRGVLTSHILATSSLSGGLVAKRRIPTGEIDATSTVSGHVIHFPRFSGNIAATSSASGSVAAKRHLRMSAIDATSTVSGRIGAKRPLHAPSISAFSALTGHVAHKVVLTPGTVHATSKVSGYVSQKNPLVFSPISALATVGGKVSKARRFHYQNKTGSSAFLKGSMYGEVDMGALDYSDAGTIISSGHPTAREKHT